MGVPRVHRQLVVLLHRVPVDEPEAQICNKNNTSLLKKESHSRTGVRSQTSRGHAKKGSLFVGDLLMLNGDPLQKKEKKEGDCFLPILLFKKRIRLATRVDLKPDQGSAAENYASTPGL